MYELPYLSSIKTVSARWQHPTLPVVNDTLPRNRKGRRHPSWMRTKGRLNRALGRMLPAEQSYKVAAVASKFRESLLNKE